MMRTLHFKTSYEDLISRIPGLFPYIENDEKGNPVLHRATDNPLGCYTKIVENIYISRDYGLSYYNDNGVIDRYQVILSKGKAYTYKHLMSLYYQYSESVDNNVKIDPDFITFIEQRIGKEIVQYEGLDRTKHDLVPDFVYLVCVQELYNDIADLQAKCLFYKQHLKDKVTDTTDSTIEDELCCITKIYERKGGDLYVTYLQSLLGKAEKLSDIFYKNALRDITAANCLKTNYSVNLYSSERDLGIVSYCPTVCKTDKIEISSDPFVINYQTNSKLRSLRRFKTYINEMDEEQSPEYGRDWLFYYRKGMVCNLTVLNDDFGNIATEKTDAKDISVGDIVPDLIAYGDVIEDITLNKAIAIGGVTQYESVTITYWTDVHLKATCNGITYDDDNNKKVTYDNFVIDTDYTTDDEESGGINHHGIKYVETYYFDADSELSKFYEISGRPYYGTNYSFNKYIKGDYDNELLYEKFEFITRNNDEFKTIKINGSDYNYTSILTDNAFITSDTAIVPNSDKKDIIHLDFYEGVSYTPTEDIDVDIDRGSTSIFDRHIRLSEVKTLTDMEEMGNGSFFEMKE